MEIKYKFRNRVATVCLILTFLITGGCASGVKKEVVPNAVLSPGVKYEIASFDIDLVAKRHVPGFLDLEQTKQVMRKQFEMELAKAGLLADSGDQNVANIAVFIDYRRIFFGEDTPFPMDKVGSPKFFYRIDVLENGITKKLVHSDEMFIKVITLAVHDFMGAPLHTVTDIKYSLVIARGVAEELKELTPEYAGYKTNDLVEAEYVKEIKSLVATFTAEKESPAYLDEKYIPDSIVQSYVSRFRNDDVSERIDAYEDITKVWINDKEAFDPIEQQLLALYKNELGSDEYDEAEAAVKALASSGLPAYKATLKEVSINAKSKDLRKLAEENINVLNDRYRIALCIHKPVPVENEVTWQERQLYNMIHADDFYLQKIAVKRIYREYPKNVFLLDALSESLNASTQGGYRAYLNDDYHAWICRVLGMSENVKYKSKLDYIATHAVYEKVRDFAEEYAEELEI